MQCMTSDYRTVRRWARSEGTGDDRGDCIASYSKAETVKAGFVPSTRALSATDSGESESSTVWRVYVSHRSVFKPGDRMGPSSSDEPDMEVISTRDFPYDQILEVRPL